MTPSSWFTVLAFFLFVAPGLLYDLCSAHKRIKRRESTFTEISRVALVSTLCSSVAMGVLVLTGALAKKWWNKQPFPNPGALVRGGSAYVADHFTALVWACALGLVVSLATALLLFWATHFKETATIAYRSAWQVVFRDHKPDTATAVYVRIKLRDGTVWRGRVAQYSPDMELADREIVLSHPIAVKPSSRGTSNTLHPDWSRVVLTGSEIVTLTVMYGDTP